MNTVSRVDLNRMRQSGEDFLLIDVLSKDSFTQKHIPGSINLPVDSSDFLDSVRSLASDKSTTIVAYCGSRKCDASAQAVSMLESDGFSNACRYEGGIDDWERAGLPIEGSLVGVR